jgi:hypothetical protein
MEKQLQLLELSYSLRTHTAIVSALSDCTPPFPPFRLADRHDRTETFLTVCASALLCACMQHDDEDQHSDRLVSTFYNDVFALNLDTAVWSPMLLGEALKPEEIESSEEEEDDDEDEEEEGEDEDAGAVTSAEAPETPAEPELAPASAAAAVEPAGGGAATTAVAADQQLSSPSPRIGAGVLTMGGTGDAPAAMLLFGGMRENAKGVEEPSNDVWRLAVSGDGIGGGWELLSG